MLGRAAIAVVALGIVLLGSAALLGRRNLTAPSADRSGLVVVTTTPVLYSLTAKVLGDHGGLVNLVPPGASPENYALRPSDATALARADIVVMNGLGLDRFIETLLAKPGRRPRLLVASAGVPTRGVPPDPHVWTDPLRAAQMIEVIARGLAEADPARATEYATRARAALSTLETLDQDIRTLLASAPTRRFVAFHPAWGYFAERYGLEQIAVVEEIPGVEPTAQQLAALIARVRATGTRALLSEPQFSSRIAEAIARDLGLTVHEVNPEGGALSPDGYAQMMRENATIFARALAN